MPYWASSTRARTSRPWFWICGLPVGRRVRSIGPSTIWPRGWSRPRRNTRRPRTWTSRCSSATSRHDSMQGLTEWTRDLLMSRGALLESDEGALRALLPAEVASALGCGEWLSLNFDAGAGADDGGEWIDRLGSLLPPNGPVIGARLREP